MKNVLRPTGNLVIIFIRQEHRAQREKMNGVYSAAIRHGWQILPLDESFSASRWREIVRLWQPLGCLIDATAMPGGADGPEKLTKNGLFGLPAVILGRDMTRRRQIFDCSAQNTRAPVDAALRKFRELGLGTFAFLGDPGRPPWSLERGRHFREAVHPLRCPSYAGANPNTESGFADLVRWLRLLPKPVGLLLATDSLAVTVYTAAQRAGREIGKDLSVIGVDNIEPICTSLSPTLTSVRLDYFQAGENAIELLRQRIEDPARPVEFKTYDVIGVVSRSSTARRYPDPRLNAGLAFIRERGCERISTTDVAAAMKCGRRMAEKLFAKHLGRTILDVVRQRRLDEAKSLLRDSHFPIDAIPGLCGYESLSHLKTFFRRETGQTMRDWRRTHATM